MNECVWVWVCERKRKREWQFDDRFCLVRKEMGLTAQLRIQYGALHQSAQYHTVVS